MIVTLGGTLATPSLLTLLQACEQPQQEALWKPLYLSEAQGKTLAAMVDRILPKTNTPGAKEAGVHQFIDLILKDCTPSEEAQEFAQGLDALDTKCIEQHSKPFAELATEKQDAFITAENDALKNMEGRPSFFYRLKQATIQAYYTSELGAQTLAYVPIPGAYQGCTDLAPDQKTWAM